MRTTGKLLGVAFVFAGVVVTFAQKGQPSDPRRTAGVQAGRDPNREAFVAANCKNQVRGEPGGAAGPYVSPPTRDATTTAITGVIAAGQKWKLLYEDTGNNADGPVGLDDGSLLFAQNEKSQVVRIDKDGKVSIPYNQTYTGGALAANARGQLFVAERALDRSIWLLEPERRLFASKMTNGEPMECQGPGVLNDLAADNKGGVYMTMVGVYYANPKGVVSGPYGDVPGNGIILSRDEKTLYVTGRMKGMTPPSNVTGNGGIVSFDVQADGSLVNERQFSWWGGDGLAIDNEGRVYATDPPGGRPARGESPAPNQIPGVTVLSPRGELLGTIPTPRNTGGIAFGGPDKKVLYITTLRDVKVWSIPTIAQGYKGRAK